MNMVDTQTRDAGTPSAPLRSTLWLLLGTVANTTWRLFIPTIGGTVVGIWIDRTYDTKPWATIIGVVVGTLIAFGLVYWQLRKVQK